MVNSNFDFFEKRCCSKKPIYKISYRIPDSEPEILFVCAGCHEIPCYQKSIIKIEKIENARTCTNVESNCSKKYKIKKPFS